MNLFSQPRATRRGADCAADPRGFTLLELMVVVGLVAGLAFLLLSGLGTGGRGTALQAGQATISQLLGAARQRALAAAQPTRVLVHADPASPLAAERYLRLLAVEELRGGEWRTLRTVSLPPGVFVVPHRTNTPAGLLADEAVWIKADGTRLHSSSLYRPVVQRQVDAPVAEWWSELMFSDQGTTATSGQLVLAPGRGRTPSEAAAGAAPVVLSDPAAVRGLQVSAYGLVVSISERDGF